MKRKNPIRIQKSIRIQKPTREEAWWKKWKKRLRALGLGGIGAVIIALLTRGKIKLRG